MPAQLLLIRGAKQLLTLRGPSGLRRGAALRELSLIEDGAVLIRDGLIAQVGTTRRLENLKEVRSAAEIEVSGAIVMPGFVDAGLSLRSLKPAALLKRRKISEYHEQNLALLRSCLQHGTLNAQLKVSGSRLHVDADISLLRQLAGIGNSPITTLRTWRIEESFAFGPAASSDFVNAARLLSKRKLVSSIEAGPHLDCRSSELVAHSASEGNLLLRLTWPNGFPHLFNAAQSHCIDRLAALSAAECELLAASAVPVVFSPAFAMLEPAPDGNLRRLADAGAPLAMSSGYDSEEMPMWNLQLAIALAVLRLKLTVEEAIVAATVNAACSLGISHSVGTLEVGKRADLIVLNLPDYREIPRRFGINHVGMVVREGRIVFNRTGWKVSAA